MNDSILAFLQQLHSAMTDNEQFRLEMTKNGDSLDVIVMPLMADDESNVPEQVKAIRSALSMPLSMRNMPLTEIASDLGERLSGFGQARSQATDAYQELLASLKDATANAKNQGSKKNTKKETVATKTPPEQTPDTKPADKTEGEQEQSVTPEAQPEQPSQGGLLGF